MSDPAQSTAESETPTRAEDLRTPSKLGSGLLRVMKAWFREDATFSAPWRKMATKDFGFAANRQYEPEDKAILEDGDRPPIVFNYTLPVLKIVAGIEINSRHEIKFLPRGVEDTEANEVLSSGSRWMADTCDAEDEQSEAFQRASICGMGWCLSDDAMVRLPNTHFATTRFYSGAVIQIDLENGKQLTGTPNHPVLTDIGWKRLCDLQEGDNLVTSAFLKRVSGLPVEQFDKVETRLKDKVDAFRAGREATWFATAPDDFYADGRGSKVHVVYADRLLSSKIRHAARRQNLHQLGLAARNALARIRESFFGEGVSLHPRFAAECKLALNGAHAPCPQGSTADYVSHFMAGRSKSFAYRLASYANALTNFIGRKLFLEIEPRQFFDRGLGYGSAVVASQRVSSAHEPTLHGGVRYSELIGDFRDWKPTLEVEARKLGGGDAESAHFVTRVVRRIVKQVSDFPVHDVGTSLGIFVAGDVITSNTEQRLDYELNKKGEYVEDAIDPREMFWDCKARKKNLIDARRMFRLMKMPIDEARDLADSLDVKNASDTDLDANWASGFETDDDGEESKPYEEKQLREEGSESDGDRREVTIIEAQWYERETYYVVAVANPGMQGQGQGFDQTYDLSEPEFKLFKDRAKELGWTIRFAKLKRRVYKRAYLGGIVLGEVQGAPLKDRFSWACITGEPDRETGLWFGLVSVMRDPQAWANKWLSQTMHIMNSNAKGGIFAEADAFEDQAEAEEDYAQTDSITYLVSGALSGAKPKIMPKPQAQFPQGFVELMRFAVDAIPKVTGINMELQGLQDANQAGILEHYRKQAAMTILATLFDSLRRFRKIIGRGRLYLMQNFIADGRLVRVTGNPNAVALTKDAVEGEYDVIVDDAPTSPNQKEVTWGIITSVLPVFKDMLTPQVALLLLKYSPLPAEIVSELGKLLDKPDPKKDQAEQLAQASAVAKIERDKAATAKDVSQAQKNQVDAQQGEVGMNMLLAALAKGYPVMPDAPKMPATPVHPATMKPHLPGLPPGTAIN